jgi:1,4-dihydroxy-2-naphthoyl-CoA hydrolase
MSLLTTWPLSLSPKDLAEWVNARLDGTLMGPLGIRAVSISAEGSVTRLEVQPQVSTPMGYVHGGATVALADSTATWTAIAALEADLKDPMAFPLAINISCQLIGNVKEGVVQGQSEVTHLGRNLTTVSTRVTAEDGRILATVNTTHYVRKST